MNPNPSRMIPQPRRRPSHPAPRRALRLVVAALLLLGAGAARAQGRVVKPWSPPGLDTLYARAAEIRLMFQNAVGDTVGGDNYPPYDRVGAMARRMLRELGRDRMAQAMGVKTAFDSLGLDTQMALDPGDPTFALLLVRNPWRPRAKCVGFIYWWKSPSDLRMQGALFFGGAEPQVRVWWTGEPAGPYELGVVDRSRTGMPVLHFTLARLDPGANFWDLVQFEGSGLDLGGVGEAAWTDLNTDGIPELVTWIRTDNDSLFTECPECPRLVTETTYIRRRGGFEPLEQRIVPTPYATFSLFVHLLVQGQRQGAARLLVAPARVDSALALGWGKRRARGAWRLESGEPNERWPGWLIFRFDSGTRARRYLVRFQSQGARWLIESWQDATLTGSSAPARAAPPARNRRGGGVGR